MEVADDFHVLIPRGVQLRLHTLFSSTGISTVVVQPGSDRIDDIRTGHDARVARVNGHMFHGRIVPGLIDHDGAIMGVVVIKDACS